MTIDLKKARGNAINFFENQSSIFVADTNDNLTTISRFNLFGRVCEYLYDWKSNWKRSQNTNIVFKKSLNTILSNLDADPKTNCYFISCSTPKIPFLKKYAVDYTNKTMSDLADRIKASPFNTNPEISNLAAQIKVKTLALTINLNVPTHPYL